MEQTPCDVSNHSAVIDAKRTTLIHIMESFEVEEVHFEGNMSMLEILSTDYDSKQRKRNPSNEQAFLRISSSLQELGACLETTGQKLPIIVEEIHSMETIIDSTTDSFTYLFLDHAKRVANLLQEVIGKNRQCIKTVIDLLKEFIVIDES